MIVKRATHCVLAIAILVASCKKGEAPDTDDSNSNLKNTASFKANGTSFNLSKDFGGDSDFPSFLVSNSPAEGLIVQFDIDGSTTFQFAGPYIANSSHDFTDGRMQYFENSEGHYDSSSYDECANDSFSFHLEKQKSDIDYMPNTARFTGTFSGRLVSREQKLDPDDPFSPTCLGPEVQIAEGKFSVIGVNY